MAERGGLESPPMPGLLGTQSVQALPLSLQALAPKTLLQPRIPSRSAASELTLGTEPEAQPSPPN